MNLREKEDRYLLNVYPKRDIVLAHGKGCYLYDENDRQYLDMGSNIAVNALGHGNEEIAETIKFQYSHLSNAYSMFYNDIRANYAEKLVRKSPIKNGRVFFSNSGTESIEAAIKTARAATGKSGIIAMMRGYHGKTMGSLSATWGKNYQEPFKPLLPGFSHVPLNKIEKLENAFSEDTSALILEIVQGEGGIRPADEDFLTKARQLCDRHGALLIIDEVQTGFGRCGKLFASDELVEPDILCLAKAIAGGLPMGATVINERFSLPMKSHSSTFGGNPVVCAAAMKTLEIIERDRLVGHSAAMGEILMKELKKLNSDKIRQVRGRGLMIGIELKEKAGPYVHALSEKGIIVLLAGANVIRLLPPLIIREDEIWRFLKIFSETIS